MAQLISSLLNEFLMLCDTCTRSIYLLSPAASLQLTQTRPSCIDEHTVFPNSSKNKSPTCMCRQDDERTTVSSPPCEITLHHNFGESDTTDLDTPFTLSSSPDQHRSCTADDECDGDEYDDSTLPMTNQSNGVRDRANINSGSSEDVRTSAGGVTRVLSDLTSHLSSSTGTTITTTSSKPRAPLAAPFEYVDRFKATPRIKPREGEKPIISTRLFPDGQSSFGSEVA